MKILGGLLRYAEFWGEDEEEWLIRKKFRRFQGASKISRVSKNPGASKISEVSRVSHGLIQMGVLASVIYAVD